ncbi:MAG: hypothetical protein WCR42_01090 [bacterium]
MKKLLFLGLIYSIFSINAFAQERIITGRVFHKNDIPLPYVQVCQPNSHNFNFTDNYGVFHLVINEMLDNNMIISLGGFTTKTIAIDSAKSYYSIELVADTTHILSITSSIPYRSAIYDSNSSAIANSNNNKQELTENITFESFIKLDYMFKDFISFLPLLGDPSIVLLNEFEPMAIIGLTLKYSRFGYGVGFGYQQFKSSTEFLDLNVHNYQYSVHFVYDILDSRHFAITPTVQFKLHNFNLHNSDNRENINLEEYLTDKEIDLKFLQWTGFVGCNLTYKTGSVHSEFGKIGLGIYGGYMFKLMDEPIVFSQQNYLRTDKKIDIKKINFGLNLEFYFDD